MQDISTELPKCIAILTASPFCKFSSSQRHLNISSILQCNKIGDHNILNQSLNIKIKLILVLLKQKQRAWGENTSLGVWYELQ